MNKKTIGVVVAVVAVILSLFFLLSNRESVEEVIETDNVTTTPAVIINSGSTVVEVGDTDILDDIEPFVIPPIEFPETNIEEIFENISNNVIKDTPDDLFDSISSDMFDNLPRDRFNSISNDVLDNMPDPQDMFDRIFNKVVN